MLKMPTSPARELLLIKPDWPAPPNVLAYTTTRQGGRSTGNYKGLNLALHVGDDRDTVLSNRQLLPHHEDIVWLDQIHSATCIALKAGCAQEQSADASVSSDVGLVCAVMTADCLPMLICDKQGKQVAAIHAGWRGLAEGVIENTLLKLNGESGQLLAWLGPAISQTHFEVGEEVRQAFADYPDAFIQSPEPTKYLADLYQIARLKLSSLGVMKIYGGEYCTYAQPELFYSHRRASHLDKGNTGRMLSAIYLLPSK
jgi:YfiH family protein